MSGIVIDRVRLHTRQEWRRDTVLFETGNATAPVDEIDEHRRTGIW